MEMVSTCNDTEINQKWKVQPHTQSEAFYVVMDKCLHRIRRSLQLQTKLLQLHNTCTVIVDAWIQQSTALFAYTCTLCMTMNPVKTQGTSEKRTSEEIINTSDCETKNFNAMQILHYSVKTNVKQ